MKRCIFLSALFALTLLAACTKEEEEFVPVPSAPGGSVPEGYFVARFGDENFLETKAPVSGVDGRVRHLRYILYKNSGEFVKEKVILTYGSGKPSWPLPQVSDTLPKGSYQAVFVANCDPSFFPFGTPAVTQPILLTYKTTYAAARIQLPGGQFSDSTEYYMANVKFSDAAPSPTVTLQRIIGMENVHRNFVDAQTALNDLVANIVAQIDYKNYIRVAVNAALPGLLKPALDKGPVGNLIYTTIGGLDTVVNRVSRTLLQPVTDLLYTQLLQRLTNDVGRVLTGNSDQSGMLASLGVLLNPWALNEARTAIVTIDNFPKTIDFNLAVQDKYPPGQRFRFDFNSTSVYAEKDILIRGFGSLFDIRRINVIKQGLIGGVIVDQTIDNSLLLNASFIDIADPLQFTVPANRRYKATYSFARLTLKSYTPQQDNAHKITLSTTIGSVGNLNGILAGIPLIGNLVDGIITDIGTLTVTAPVYLPALNVENLQLSGGWNTPTSY